MTTFATTTSLGAAAPADVCDIVAEARALAFRALKRMYRADRGLFCHCLRRQRDGIRTEGVSRRYTAVVLLALAGESPDAAMEVLAGESPGDVCGRLVAASDQAVDLGEVALTLWAARVVAHPGASRVLSRLRAMGPADGAYPTVELAWALSSLVVGDGVADLSLADTLATRLMASFCEDTGLFRHWPAGASPSWLRGHVCCFADLVYPSQALSLYHRVCGGGRSIAMARRCADRMCELQGPQGQWWWHYDVRTGRVVEPYPVYSVHQDAMGPMALAAVDAAAGTDHREAVARSVRWMAHAPEIGGSLIDREADLIWRKVARREPGKLTRSLQAAASRVHPRLRVPGVDAAFPPTVVDYESRPYHMAWLLHAFPAGRSL